MTVAKTIEMLEGVVSRSVTRGKMIERLRSGNTQKLAMPDGNSAAAAVKRKYAEELRSKKVNTGLAGKELE